MKAGDLERILGGKLLGNRSADISRFVIDSRRVKPGDTFIALKGERRDGHDFIGDAFKRGAVGAISERKVSVPEGRFLLIVESVPEALRELARYRRSSFKGKVIGIAGSVGKTTTKELTYHLLSYVARSYRSEGNLNSQIGLPLVLANMPPDVDFAVLELGASKRGEVLRLTEIAKPKLRVITAIGEEHLETFGTLKDVIEGNGEILYLFDEESFAILPYYTLKFYSLPKDRVLTFGSEGDLRARGIKVSLEGVEFFLSSERFSIPVLNLGIVDNVLASFGVLKALGYEPFEFRNHLSKFKAPKGRMNVLNFEDFYIIDDTYNANPPSVRNALRTLSMLKTNSKKIMVLGDMLELGERSVELHSEIGAFASRMGIEYGIFYGRDMYHAYKEFVRRGGKGVFLKEKDDALEEILKWAKDKNIILLKGSRGMRMETVVEHIAGAIKT